MEGFGNICDAAGMRVLGATGYLHESGRVSMDEAEGGDRGTNPPTHLILRVVVLLYGVRQTNRIGLPRVFRRMVFDRKRRCSSCSQKLKQEGWIVWQAYAAF